VSPTVPRLPIIGLAGGIGAGKSTIARALADEGCLVADSDALARQAYNDPEIRRQLVAWWGDRVRDCHACHAEPDSMPPPVDRRAIAAIVFEHPAERARLEALIHPWIARAREALFAAAPAGTRALVIDAPLLFETGLDQQCDRVIFVDSMPETRLSRVRSARGWDTAELGRREAAQWPLERKRALATDLVRNDADAESLHTQLDRILRQAAVH
jgi:dephospho-CoA kinase